MFLIALVATTTAGRQRPPNRVFEQNMSAPEAAAEAHGRLQDVAHERRLARAAAAHQSNAGAVTAAAPPRATPRGPTLHMINGRPRAAAVPSSSPSATARFAPAASSGSAAANVVSNARPVAGETPAALKKRLRELQRKEGWANLDQSKNQLIMPGAWTMVTSGYVAACAIPCLVGGPAGWVMGGAAALATTASIEDVVVRVRPYSERAINDTGRRLTTIKNAITEVQEQLGDAGSNDSSSDSESGFCAEAESLSAYIDDKRRDRVLRGRRYAI